MRVALKLALVTLVPALQAGSSTEAAAQERPAGRGAASVAEIRWDEWDVAHIDARDDETAMYGLGWAQMQAHGDLLLSLYARARGQAAAYWGESWIASDTRMHQIGIPDRGRAWQARLTAGEHVRLTAFAAGANAYARRFPERIAPANRAILPIRLSDPLMHVLHTVVGNYVAGEQLGRAASLPLQDNPPDDALKGSNAYAIAPSRSKSGDAMLLINPHLPWGDHYTWFEAQISVSGHSYYGVAQVGSPFLGIAFNEHGGWTHTVNQLDGADLYKLKLDGDRYLLDGRWLDLASEKRTIQVREKDGRLTDRTFMIQRSVHGPLVRRDGTSALAIRIAGFDSFGLIQQYWDMAKADGLESFEAAASRLQMPFFNTIYASRAGDIYYLYGGRSPNRRLGDHRFWSGVIPGDRSSFLWEGTLPYEKMPHFRNPPGGFIQNANDPPWLTTLPQVLKPGDYPAHLAPPGPLDWRAQQSLRQITEQPRIGYDDLVEMEGSTRIESADRLLPDLLDAAQSSFDPLVVEARTILARWDRRSETGSRGAILYQVWARKLFKLDPQKAFAAQWSPDRPLQTPNGLADPGAAVKLLTEAAAEVRSQYGRLDIGYGEAVRFRRSGIDLPASGGDVYVGSFRASWFGKAKDGVNEVQGGNSFVAAVSFGKRLHATGLLPYGNATAPGFGSIAAQARYFSDNRLRPIHFYPDDVVRHTVRTERIHTRTGTSETPAGASK